jgi:3-oxoacyl-(acyl-carrier-protein) synthase
MGADNMPLRHVLCNAFGFGGNDSSLVFSREPRTSGLPGIPGISGLSGLSGISGISGFSGLSGISGLSARILSSVKITSEDELLGIREFVSPLEARRMGKLLKSSLLASLRALREAGIEKPDAIITATSLGCWENSEALLRQLDEEGEVMLKPTWFMQSTHNTISSLIAIRTHCHGYNVTYATEGPDPLRWALHDAEMLLKSGQCKTVLVGFHDESTPLYRSLMARLKKTADSPLSSVTSTAIVLCSE